MKLSINITTEILEDIVCLETGLYEPLAGFMTYADYNSVVNNMTLQNGSVWTLPISLDVSHDIFEKAVEQSRLYFLYEKEEIGYMKIEDCYKVNLQKDIEKIYKTDSKKHPGVKNELEKNVYRIGGKTFLTNKKFLKNAISSKKTKEIFRKKGWKTIVGFQTRNPIHRAHEYLQRTALEYCDGLFINPSMGWKKIGDFTEQAVQVAYQEMIENFYPKNRVYFEGYRVCFKYAGPREAVFHAILRRNLGCTHFIIGRDHAGVGKYYEKYEAHELAKNLSTKHDLGINLFLFCGPFYCQKCGMIVTEKNCVHSKENHNEISGTDIREKLANSKIPEKIFMREEIAKSLIELKENMFIS